MNKYIKENYDTYRITFPKGRKATLQAHAAAREESLNGFVNRAIDETVERDNSNDPLENASTGSFPLTADEIDHIEKRRVLLAKVEALMQQDSAANVQPGDIMEYVPEEKEGE